MKTAKPIGFAMGYNIFLAFSGITTALLIITFFSEELQGLYYTILSFTALKVFLDAGFSHVIVSFVSQNKNKIDVVGEVEFKEDGFKNLSNIFNYARKRYLLVSCFGFIILHILAWFFLKDYIFSGSVVYWFFISLLFSFNVLLIPHLSLIEGLGYLSSIYSFRLRSSIVNSILSWLVICLGGGVLCLLVLNFAMLVQNFFYIRGYNYIFRELKKGAIDYRFIRPVVKRFSLKIGASFLTGYFLNNGMVPFIFKFISPALAGQYGLTWSLFSIISTLPKQFLLVIRPKLGLLFNDKKYKQFWNLFMRNFVKSISLFLVLALSILSMHYLFENNFIVNRLLNRNNVFLMAVLFFIINTKGNFDYFFRPQLIEPLYLYNVASSLSILILMFISIGTITLEHLFLILIASYGVFSATGVIYNVYKFYKKYITSS